VSCVAGGFDPGHTAGVRSAALIRNRERVVGKDELIEAVNPGLRLSGLNDRLGPYRRTEDLARYQEGLRQAGLPE
jgi:hypothetical protein